MHLLGPMRVKSDEDLGPQADINKQPAGDLYWWGTCGHLPGARCSGYQDGAEAAGACGHKGLVSSLQEETALATAVAAAPTVMYILQMMVLAVCMRRIQRILMMNVVRGNMPKTSLTWRWCKILMAAGHAPMRTEGASVTASMAMHGATIACDCLCRGGPSGHKRQRQLLQTANLVSHVLTCAQLVCTSWACGVPHCVHTP
jgi:hypothetical protein